MKFLLRDDDTCAMTRPEEIEACYGRIWDDVPISLSVTPFRIPGRTTGVPASLVGSSDVLPLEQNAELVAFLREQIRNGRIDIALHGYHHDRPGGRAEFDGGHDLIRKAREGRAHVEQVLGHPVKIFVPPNNTLSAAGFDAVVAAGMDLVSNQTRARLRPWWTGPDALSEACVAAGHALRARVGEGGHAFRIRRFPTYRQVPYQTVGPDHGLPELCRSLEVCRRVGGVFVLATHYHAFDRRMKSGESIREGVMRLVELAGSFSETRFVRYEGLW